MSDENPAQSSSQYPTQGTPQGTGPGTKPADRTSTGDDCLETKCPDPPKREGAPPAPAAKTPSEQLEALKQTLETQQAELQKLEPVKISVADLEQRIQALEKTVDGAGASEASHKEFYRATKVQASEYELFIKSMRCDLKLDEKQKQCVKDATQKVKERVDRARMRRDDANKDVKAREAKHKATEDELNWQKKYYDFLKAGVQQQVTRLRDDLKALKALADPTKDQCMASFYLSEMEDALRTKEGADRCWNPELSIGDFLQCWPWANCYRDAWDKAIVAFNEAEAAEKRAKSELEQARKAAAELDKLAKEAETKRRDWILKELKECCALKPTAS